MIRKSTLPQKGIGGIEVPSDATALSPYAQEEIISEVKGRLLGLIKDPLLKDCLKDDLIRQSVCGKLSMMQGLNTENKQHYVSGLLREYIKTLLKTIPLIEESEIIYTGSVTNNLVESLMKDTFEEYCSEVVANAEDKESDNTQFFLGLKNNPKIVEILSLITKKKAQLFDRLVSLKNSEGKLALPSIAREKVFGNREILKSYTGVFDDFLEKKPGFSNTKKNLRQKPLKHGVARLIARVYLCSVGIIDHQSMHSLHRIDQQKQLQTQKTISETLGIEGNQVEKQFKRVSTRTGKVLQQGNAFKRIGIKGATSTVLTEKTLKQFLNNVALDAGNVEKIVGYTDYNSFLGVVRDLQKIGSDDSGNDSNDLYHQRMQVLLEGLEKYIFTDRLIGYFEETAPKRNTMLTPVFTEQIK